MPTRPDFGSLEATVAQQKRSANLGEVKQVMEGAEARGQQDVRTRARTRENQNGGDKVSEAHWAWNQKRGCGLVVSS